MKGMTRDPEIKKLQEIKMYCKAFNCLPSQIKKESKPLLDKLMLLGMD